MLIAVNHHYIRPRFAAPYPSIFGVTPDAFAAQLALLAKAAPFVGLADVVAAVRDGRPLPERCWLITFDDGLREQHALAWPILRKLGVPAAFFVNTAPVLERRIEPVHALHLLRARVAPERIERELPRIAASLDIELPGMGAPSDASATESNAGEGSNGNYARVREVYRYDAPEVGRLKYALNFGLLPIERRRLLDACLQELLGETAETAAGDLYMTPEQIRELGRCGCIGTHGHEHVALGRLPTRHIYQQIRISCELLESWTGAGPAALSYPYGSADACDARTAEVAAEAGMRVAFTMERAGNATLDEPLRLARCACNDLPGGSRPLWTIDRVFAEIAGRECAREAAGLETRAALEAVT